MPIHQFGTTIRPPRGPPDDEFRDDYAILHELPAAAAGMLICP
jgi:hypothetical protein